MAPFSGTDAEQLKDHAQRDLLDLLEGIRGKKNLVVQKSLAGLINIFVKFSTLQEYGVDKIFWLETGNVDTSQRHVVFLARGENSQTPMAIADQIKQLRARDSDHQFHIFWTPRRTLVSDKVLESEGILGDVHIAELPVYFVPLESDVYSLELDDAFDELFLRGDPTSIYLSAKALMALQIKLGLFPRITGKGDNARRLVDLLARMRSEMAVANPSPSSAFELSPSPTLESLIIIDRQVDFGTVLLTQLTYEGLLDEVFQIQNNQTEVDTSVVGASSNATAAQSASAKSTPSPTSQQTRKRKVQLDSTDKLYEQLRDANFAIVGPLLNKIARRLEKDFESRHGAKSTSELREFVQKLPVYQAEQQSLKIHSGLTEEVIKFTKSDVFNRALEIQHNIAAGGDASYHHDNIEEMIARETPIATVLRLLCLESVFCGGMKPKDLERFKVQILQSYGYQHMLTIDALDKLHLLQSRGAIIGPRTNYPNVRKSLRLIVDDVNESNPEDIAYVYSGYAPLSIRVIQCVIQKQQILSLTKGSQNSAMSGSSGASATGWKGFEDVLKNVQGPTFDEVQRGEDKAVKARQILNGSGEKKAVFIFFLGGITFTEIAALRFIAKQEETRRRIIICTTSIISGSRMMQAALEETQADRK
ncbi:MAG: hypothetical protein M1814_002018 [Vezdaea aestivalis]|nr:MAG: hypothetical protein M1814_002018 [Vezdaea aestivalis]